MASWIWEETNEAASVVDELDVPPTEMALASASLISPATQAQQGTTKIPPYYDGTKLLFTYEEAVLDWSDLTELSVEKRGPALKRRLEGAAGIYKNFLLRDELKAEGGVEYLLKTLRPYFVKGAPSVFLWRFMQLFKFHRGHQDMQLWLG